MEGTQIIRRSLRLAFRDNRGIRNIFLRPLLMCGVLFLSTLLVLPAMAQIYTGGLTGTVRDASGAVVPDTQITLVNDQTGVVQTTQSTSSGTYVFQSVNAGTYTLRAEHAGFGKFVSKSIEVHIQHVVTIDVSLTTGSVQQEVTVTAGAPLLQAESAAVGQTIEGAQINDLPLNGRNWASLAQLSAGVSAASTQFSGAPGSAYFAINGVNVWQTDFRLNGIDDNVELYGGPGPTNSNVNVTPPPDAIQEFTLQTGNYSAEFGHSASGVINAVMKSGTNSYHGNLWEYIRNDAFDANDYFSNQNGQPKAEYRQNQFGGTFGGPLSIPKVYNGKNRTFFFVDYQGTRIVQPVSYTQTVPTDLMRSSGFSNLQDLITFNSGTKTDALGRIFPYGAVLDPATTRSVAGNSVDPVSGLTNSSSNPIFVRDPFYTGGSVAGITDFTGSAAMLNQIPSNRLDPNAVSLLNLYPQATSAGFTNNYFLNSRQTQTINQFDFRIDENISKNDILFAAFNWSHFTIAAPNALPGIADGGVYGTGTNYIPVWATSLGYTHVFSPSLTNEAHYGFTQNLQQNLSSNATEMGIPEQFGILGVPQTLNNGGLPQFGIAGLAGLGPSSSMPTISTIKSQEYLDNVTKVYRSHTFKVGVQVDRMRGDVFQPTYSRGSFNFSGQYSDVPDQPTQLLGIADLLLLPVSSTTPNGIDNLGGLTSFSGSSSANNRDVRYYVGTYFQDDWKATPNLTFNLGLRWDHFSPYAEIDGRQANLVQDGGNGATGTYYIPKKGCDVPRAASFDALLAADNINIVCTSNSALGDSQKTNFAPRFGFAYRMGPNWVVRGGYGIAYGALANIGFSPTLGNNYPFVYVNTFDSNNAETPLAVMETALTNVNVEDPTLVNPNGLNLKGREFDYKTPYTQTFNLTTQYQLTRNDSIQVGYVGTLGRHLDSLTRHNTTSEILPPGTDIHGYVPFPDLAPNTRNLRTNATSNYRSMQMTFQHQTGFGLTLLGNYVLSKCMTDQAFYAAANQNYRAEWLPGFGIKKDYALCDTDSTHVVHLSGTYKLPIGKGTPVLGNANRVLNAIIGGWNINYIYTFQSGQPFSVPCPVATTANFGCYANLVEGEDPYAGGRTPEQWLNPAAFSNPPVATAVGQTDYSPLGGDPMPVRGPHFNNIDLSLFKEFEIERVGRLEFRAEAFNFTNTPQFGQPGNLDFLNATNFSQITSLRNTPRLVQFAMKLYF